VFIAAVDTLSAIHAKVFKIGLGKFELSSVSS
jgi:hypothetical protein